MASAPPLSQPAREGADAAAVEEDGYELEEKDWSRFKLARVFKQFVSRGEALSYSRGTNRLVTVLRIENRSGSIW